MLFFTSWVSTDRFFLSGELQQQSIEQYAQKLKKPSVVPRVDKAGVMEHLLAIVATADLVCSLFFFD